MNVEVCSDCGSVTLDWTTLERLMGVQQGQLPGGPQPVPLRSAPKRGHDTTVLGELPPPPSNPPPIALTPSNPPLAGPASQPPPPIPNLHEPVLGGMQLSGDNHEPQFDTNTKLADGDAFDRQLAANAAARQRRQLYGGLGAFAGVVVIAGLAVGYVLLDDLQGATPIPPAPQSADLTKVLTEKPPQPRQTGEVSVEPEAAAAEPEPEPPKAPTASSLIARGWQQVETRPEAAAATFQQALALRPTSAEANYGYGYALLEQGNTAGARPYLCKAQKGSDIEVQRDVTSLLNKHSLTCN